MPVAGDPGLLGTTLAGRYVLVRLLGDGGMGAVYKAADRVLGRFVAVKLLHPLAAEKPSTVERFVREARAAAAIGHPNIVDVLDFGYDGSRPYLVMEYVKGRPLSHVIATEKVFSIARACRVATHALAGLAAAHARGILHRDMKPANLMLTARLGDTDFIKICDFGFAALITPDPNNPGERPLTPKRTVVGTAAYAAPERLQGDIQANPAMDIYSVGVVLFEMLAGRRPFATISFRELVRKLRYEAPPSIQVFRPDLPIELVRVLEKALSRESERRFASATDLANALVPFGGSGVPEISDEHSDIFSVDLLRLTARRALQQETRRTEGPSRAAEQESVAEEDGGAIEEASSTGKGGPAEGHSRQTEAVRSGAEHEATERTIAPQLDSFAPRAATVETGLPSHADELANAAGRGQIVAAGKRGAVRATDERDRTTEHITPDPIEVAPRGPALEEDLFDELDERLVIGELVLTLLRSISKAHGERALRDLLNGLPPSQGRVYRDGITAEDWVPYRALCGLLAKIDAELGQNDLTLAEQCGRAAAIGIVDRLQARVGETTPRELLGRWSERGPRILRGFRFVTRRLGENHARIEVFEEGPSSLIGSVALVGLLDALLGACGARDTEVCLLGSVALGDPVNVYEASWL